jgi:hypothetical protein
MQKLNQNNTKTGEDIKEKAAQLKKELMFFSPKWAETIANKVGCKPVTVYSTFNAKTGYFNLEVYKEGLLLLNKLKKELDEAEKTAKS